MGSFKIFFSLFFLYSSVSHHSVQLLRAFATVTVRVTPQAGIVSTCFPGMFTF